MSFRFQLRTYLILLSLLILVLVVAYQQFLIINQSVHSTFALEQVRMFHKLADSHSNQKTGNRDFIIQSVEDYYPSGTKQIKGSVLDSLVEDCRRFTIKQIKLRQNQSRSDAPAEKRISD